MNAVTKIEAARRLDEAPPEGTRWTFNGQERVFYDGYWIKTYPVPADTLAAKRRLIEALTRRLFNHTEHGLNIPGSRLGEARRSYEAESDPARRRIKAAMLAGALFNRATDIFTKLVELQEGGIEVRSDDALMKECGRCLLEAMDLGRFVLHRSGDEGIDELWGEPLRAFSVPIEDFCEGRYIKIGQTMRDIDRIADAMVKHIGSIPVFEGIGPIVREFAEAARIKTETLRTDPDIFDVWSRLVAAGEKLIDFVPKAASDHGNKSPKAPAHSLTAGIQLIRTGRDLVFYITRARTPMPKSTQEYVERCATYFRTGRVPFRATPLPE